MTKTVEIDGAEYSVEIAHKFSGRYYPATLTDPAEYPDFEWWIEQVTDEDGAIVTDSAIISACEEELEKIASDLETEAYEDAQDARDAYREDHAEREW